MKADVHAAVKESLACITKAWRRGEPQGMAEMLDPEIVMVLPDFADRIVGRDGVIESFADRAGRRKIFPSPADRLVRHFLV
jgi:hypothetical protein